MKLTLVFQEKLQTIVRALFWDIYTGQLPKVGQSGQEIVQNKYNAKRNNYNKIKPKKTDFISLPIEPKQVLIMSVPHVITSLNRIQTMKQKCYHGQQPEDFNRKTQMIVEWTGDLNK